MSEELKPEVAPVEPVAGKLRVEQRILIWLGFYRDLLPAEAITEMQEIATTLAAHPPAAPTDALVEALREMLEAVCGETGFAQAVRAESGFAYPWPALDLAEAKARAALAAMQEAGE
jgi:hypothetical protein